VTSFSHDLSFCSISKEFCRIQQTSAGFLLGFSNYDFQGEISQPCNRLLEMIES
jgi:hypothetical protein